MQDIGPAGPRVVEYQDLMAKYGLEVVAGNWLYMPYSGYATRHARHGVPPVPLPGRALAPPPPRHQRRCGVPAQD